ncbi:putative hydrolase [Vibrio vulnificus]|nr:putative hydrolase [Vibrio vulnificus]
MSFKQKLHAHGWFILINALVLMLIASRYFAFLPEFPTDPLGITFILAGTWGR